MKKTIALVLAMMFALCAFVTAFAEPGDSTTTTTSTTAATTESTTVANDDVTDFETTTTTKESTTATTASSTGTTAAGTTDASTTVTGTTATTVADVTVTVSGTAYEGQDQEGSSTTTKKPAKVDTTIPSTGSGVVVPAIALLALAAGTVAVIKTKKED